MDNLRFSEQLQQGCRTLGISLSDEVAPRLHLLMNELIRWNAKVKMLNFSGHALTPLSPSPVEPGEGGQDADTPW